MKTWKHGDMETQKNGNMETWKHGNMETWTIRFQFPVYPCRGGQENTDLMLQIKHNKIQKYKNFYSQIYLQLSAHITTIMKT